MARYYARVELHNASWPEDYENLHDELKRYGFTNCGNFGEMKRLPTGFYVGTKDTDEISEVIGEICEIANNTGYKNEIVVVQSAGASSFLSKKC